MLPGAASRARSKRGAERTPVPPSAWDRVAVDAMRPIEPAIVLSMATTTMQLEAGLRDELAEIAKNDFSGVPLAEALRRLIREHQINRIMARYAELQTDPDEWATYRAEARVTDNAAADGLPSAQEEYPEYNS
jgi:hypothetical protein